MSFTDESKILHQFTNHDTRLTSKQKRREERRKRTNAYIERVRQRELLDENNKQIPCVPENKYIWCLC